MTGIGIGVLAIKHIIGQCGQWQIRKCSTNSGTSYVVEAMADDKGLLTVAVNVVESLDELKAYREKLESNLRDDEANLGSDVASDVRSSMWQLVNAIEQAETLVDGL